MNPTPLSKPEKIALSVTKWIGSIWSVLVHTILFAGAFILALFGVPLDRVLLILTTIVSLEAIYLSIFIQMSVNYQAKALATVEKEIDEIAEDVEDIQENVEEIQDNVEGIAENVEGIQEDVEEISHDVEEIQEDVEEMQEDIEDIQEDIQEDVKSSQKTKEEEDKKTA